MKSKKNIGIYCRFSSAKGGEISLEEQERQGLEWCKENGYEGVVYNEGGGVSGATLLKDRIVGSKMIEDIESGKLQGIYVKRMDRIFRNDLEAIQFRVLIESHGIPIYEDGIKIDVSDDNSRFIYSIRALLADDDRRKLTKKFTEFSIVGLNKGELVRGKATFGYKREKRGRGGNAIVVDEKKREILLDILEYFTSSRVSRYEDLYDYGKDRWNLKYGINWYKILVSNKQLRKYRGEYLYRFVTKYGTDEYKDYTLSAPIIVSKDLYDRVCSKRNMMSTTKKHRYKGKDSTSVYTGVIYCNECGSSMSRRKLHPQQTKQVKGKQVYVGNLPPRVDEDGNYIYKWVCTRGKVNRLEEFIDRETIKHTTSIYDAIVDEVIRKALHYITNNSQFLKHEYLKKLEEEYINPDSENEVIRLNNKIARVENERNNLIKAIEGGVYLDDELQDKIHRAEQLKTQILESRKELEKVNNDIFTVANLKSKFGWKENYTKKYTLEKILNMSDDELSVYVDDLIHSVRLKGKIRDEQYSVEIKLKYKLIGDRIEFDKEHWYAFKEEHIDLFKNDKERFYEIFNKKFNVVDGKDTLVMGIGSREDSERAKNTNNSSQSIENLLMSFVLDVYLNDLKEIEDIVFIGFIDKTLIVNNLNEC